MIFGISLSFLLSQIFAGIAIIADTISFQFKKREKILIAFIIAASCIAIHYILLERYVAASIVGGGILRFIISYKDPKKYWIYIFSIAFGISTFLLYKDIFDIIILIGMIFITIGVFQKDDRPLRLFMMCGTSLVILYNILIFSPIGVLLESIFLTSNVIGYYRHYLR